MSYAPRRRAYEIAAPSSASTSLLRAFRVVLDTIEYGVLFVDEDLRVRMHNRAFREIWKVPGDFLSKKPALRELMEYVREHGHVYNVTDDDWDSYVQARLDAIRSGDTTPMESQRTDGTVIQHQCTALPDGGYILTYFDITAGKLAEQALRDSEQRLVDALESTSDGFALFDKDDRLAVCNSRYRELYPQLADVLVLGTPAETIIRAVAERNLVRDAQGRVEEWVQKRMAQHRNPTGPQLQPQADGRWLQIDERKTDEGGTVIVFTDITEIKRHEQELAEANRMQGVVLNELHAVLDAVDYGILFLDADLNVRLHNRAYREIWEMPETLFADSPTLADLLNYSRQTGLFGVPEEQWEAFVTQRIEAIRRGELPQSELNLSNGKVLQFQCIKLPDGGRMLTYFDITERKRAGEALRESEERFRNLIEGSIQGILIDQQRKPVFVNQSFADMLGYESPEEILAMDSMDPCVVPHERARLRAYSEARLKGDGIAPMHYEYDALRKDGSIVTFQNVARRISWEGQPAIQSTVIDVTERRRVEQALRDSEERYALVTEAAEDGIYEWFIETDELYVLPRLNEFFKFESGELGSKEWRWNDRIHPDDLGRYLDTLRAHFEGVSKRWECEYRFRDKTGQYRWILDHGSTVRNEEGKAIRLVGAIRDITQRKEALEALRQSEERYALAMQAINEGVYDWNIATDEIYYSPRVQAAFALSPNELRTRGDWFNRVHPDDRQTYKGAFVAHFKGETERFVCEYRFHAGDGTLRWARQHGLALRDEHGRAYRMIGSTGDITALRKSEQELQEKTAILETTLESTDQGISMFDAELNVVMFNPRFLEILGFPSDRFQRGNNFKDFLRYNAERGEYGEGDIEEQVRERVELAKRFEPHHFERTRPDGTVIEVRGKPLPSGGFLTTYTDVTERKRREQELAEKSAILEATLESMDQGISMVDANLNVIAFNRKFLELLDFPPDRFKPGFRMEQAFRYNAERGEYGEGDIEEQVRERVELAKRFEPHHFERTRPDGMMIEIRGSPVAGGGFVTTYTDVTERKRAEQALRDSEERYAVATQAATEGIYEWDVVTNKLYLSERAKEIFAFEAVDDPTAKVWNSRVHPDDFSLYRQARIDHFRGRTDHFECEYRFHDMGGQYIWILERGIAVRNEAGRAIRMIGALSDITARKSAEIELRQAKEQAEAATHTKSTFLANMSHELRTPLNAIIGFTRLVMRRSKDVLPAKQFENLEKIRTSADHLLSLINDILDLSKIEAGRMDIRLSTVTVESLVDTCLRTVEPLIQSETLQLIKEVEPGLPTIVVDQEKLKQILMNLLSNAVKFTEKGSIKVTASRQGHELVIVVADTGIGIPEHTLQQVFDEFRQVDDSRTRQRGGTGLGLSISRHLARLMGGDVTVVSTVGVGSTFTVSLPLRSLEEHTGPTLTPVQRS